MPVFVPILAPLSVGIPEPVGLLTAKANCVQSTPLEWLLSSITDMIDTSIKTSLSSLFLMLSRYFSIRSSCCFVPVTVISPAFWFTTGSFTTYFSLPAFAMESISFEISFQKLNDSLVVI